MVPGEVGDFDPRPPPVIATHTDEPLGLLGLFGPQGERMHVRSGR